MSVLMSGTVLAQIITVAVTPVLTRLYTPTEFGILALFTSIVVVLTAIMTLRYEMAIVLAEDEEESANVFALSLLITACITIFLFIIVWLLRENIAGWLNTPGLAPWLWLVPVNAMLMGLYKSFEFWSTRNKRYKKIAASRVSRAIGVVGGQLSGGFLRFGAGGLVGGQVLGQFLATSTLMYDTLKGQNYRVFKKVNTRLFRPIIVKFKDFPMFSSTQALVNAFSQNMAPFLLGVFFGTSVVGFYSLALKLVKMPTNLISESFNQVYFQNASDMYNKGKNLGPLLIKSTLYLAAGALIPAILLIIFAPWAFSFILGEEWREAGVYSSWLMVWLYFGFINRPAIGTIQVLKIQKILFNYELLLLVFRIAAMLVAANYYTAVTGIAIYSLLGAVFNLAIILITIFIVRRREAQNEPE
ncbi:lipopolysaccharide biosynthesis protein [Marinococcus halophilus]|uniref:lipopolysaccharide biosynthesis protein n=1 Tax=Marinococcus halophilus TaxID=1371 RepID=UPI0024681DA7|nr:oligosaccharide flippase family protein [Marinococcus halophilus]